MKRLLFFLFFILILPNVLAIPRNISIEGTLESNEGVTITDSKSVRFSIYPALTGGTAIFTQTSTITPDSKGRFNQILSNVNLNFSKQFYLGIKIGSDAEATPRVTLTSSPYSFKSNSTDFLADGGELAGTTYASGDLIPTVNKTFSIGSSTWHFLKGWFTDLFLGGKITSDDNIYLDGNVNISGFLNVSSRIQGANFVLTNGTNIFDLGGFEDTNTQNNTYFPETDPLWLSNFTRYNDSWSTDTNTQNTTKAINVYTNTSSTLYGLFQLINGTDFDALYGKTIPDTTNTTKAVHIYTNNTPDIYAEDFIYTNGSKPILSYTDTIKLADWRNISMFSYIDNGTFIKLNIYPDWRNISMYDYIDNGTFSKLSGATFTGDVFIGGVHIFDNGNISINNTLEWGGGSITADNIQVNGYINSDDYLYLNDDVNISGFLNVTGQGYFGGNVGIGTTSPDRMLHLNASEAKIRLQSTGGTGISYDVMSANDGTFRIYDGTDYRFNINAGKVGIGTTSPQAKLSLGPDTGLKLAVYDNGASNQLGIGLQSNLMEFIADNTNNDFTFGVGTSGSLSRLMTIEGTGNVGIGTTSPNETLHVNGNLNVEGDIFYDGALKPYSPLIIWDAQDQMSRVGMKADNDVWVECGVFFVNGTYTFECKPTEAVDNKIDFITARNLEREMLKELGEESGGDPI